MASFRFLLITTLHVCVHSWILHTSHIEVVQNETKNIVLSCFYDGSNNDQSAIETMGRVRILKLKGFEWQTLAETDSIPTVQPNSKVFVTSRVAEPRDSYLTVTWAQGTNDTAGLYKCEVDGFASNDEFVSATTSLVHIVVSSKSINQLNDLLINLTKRTERESESLQNILRLLQQNLKTFQNRFSNETLSIREELQSFQEKNNTNKDANSKFERHYVEARNWPIGPVAFPAPKGECPQSAIDTWELGYVKLTLNGTLPSPGASQGNHLLKPLYETVGSRQFAYLRSCRKTSGNGLDWPKGSYCINSAKTGVCPSHFIKSILTITHPSQGIEVTDKDPLFYYTYTYGTSLVSIFCCRSDGDVDEPILLPTSWPFYLYRVNGKCQKVQFADVMNEWMEMTTADYSVSLNSGLRPDGSLKNGRLELCYYSGHQKGS